MQFELLILISTHLPLTTRQVVEQLHEPWRGGHLCTRRGHALPRPQLTEDHLHQRHWRRGQLAKLEAPPCNIGGMGHVFFGSARPTAVSSAPAATPPQRAFSGCGKRVEPFPPCGLAMGAGKQSESIRPSPKHCCIVTRLFERLHGVQAVGNRGLGNEGLVFEAGKPYEGYAAHARLAYGARQQRALGAA